MELIENENWYSTKELAEGFNVTIKTIISNLKLIFGNNIDVNRKLISKGKSRTYYYNETVKQELMNRLAKNQMNQGKNATTGKLAVKEVISKEVSNFNDNEILINSFKIMTESFNTLVKLIQKQDERITVLENKSLPAPTISTRDEIRKCVIAYARKEEIEVPLAWTELYEEYEYRRHYSIIRRARHNNMAPIDYAESVNLLDDLLSVAKVMK